MDESILRHIEGLVGKSMTNSELESILQQKSRRRCDQFPAQKKAFVFILVEQTSIKIV